MMYKQLDVGLSVYGAASGDTRPQQKRPLAPRPSYLSIGGVTQNFRTVCSDCDRGMIREPDGYGCVQWTSCYSCGGIGEAND